MVMMMMMMMMMIVMSTPSAAEGYTRLFKGHDSSAQRTTLRGRYDSAPPTVTIIALCDSRPLCRCAKGRMILGSNRRIILRVMGRISLRGHGRGCAALPIVNAEKRACESSLRFR